jgi:spermidine synthase
MADSNVEFLAHQDTTIGTLILRRRELLSRPGTVITEIMLDHALLMSSCNTVSERALSRIALEMYAGDGLEVLVGGLGLGYTAWEVLRSPRVARVEVVELVPAAIEWMRDGLLPLSTDLGDAGNHGFYTAAGLRAARRHLAPDGVLGVWSYAESSPFADALREVFGEVRIEPVTFHNELTGEDATDWLFFARA